MSPSLVKLGLLDYVVRAWRDGVRRPVAAYVLTDGAKGPYADQIVAWRYAAEHPRYGPRLLAHEAEHHASPHRPHDPWYSFTIFCAHGLRVRDPDGLLLKHAAFVEEVMKGV